VITSTTIRSIGERRRERSVVGRLVRYHVRDVALSRWVAACGLFFASASWGMLQFSDGGDRALLSLLNIVLFILPLLTITFGTVYLYSAREFTEMLLAQPIRRRDLFAGLYLGIALPFAAAFVIGTIVPFLFMRGASVEWASLLTLLAVGAALIAIFGALAALIATRTDDRLRGLAIALAVWLAAAFLYDGLVLLALALFGALPLEKPLLGLILANPIDLARILMVLRLDVSALMGYTGAVFHTFFGSTSGMALAATALAAWTVTPILLGARAFARKDF